MANRTRPIILRLAVTESEKRLIEKKMEQLGTKNFGAYARKMLIDGYIIKVDYTQQKKLAAAVSRAASNINQICRRVAGSASERGNIELIVSLFRVEDVGKRLVYSSSDWLDFSNCHISFCLSFSSVTSSS